VSLSPADLETFAAELAASPERWSHLVRYADDVRVFAQIWDDDEVNAWVICWSRDQDTGFHDHDDSGAAIAVVSGRVREDRLALGGPPHSREIAAGETFTVPPVAIHRVLHAGEARAVTIHAYSPPLRRTGVYRLDVDGRLERESMPFEVELRGEPVAA
jgi:mannose-6-phosphate isomerase-like protein (cupin superfamily)